MFRQSIFFVFSLIIAASLFGPTVTHASYDGDTVTAEVKEDSTSLFRRDFYTIEFLNNPNISESAFTMRLASYGDVSGCATMSKSKVKTEQINDSIRVTAKDSQIRLKKRAPRYTPYDCEFKKLESYFDIKMDRDGLLENGIKKLMLTSEKYGDFGESELDITEDRLIIKHSTINGNEIVNHLVTFWFFPKDTVILHAPSAKAGQNVQSLIRDFGISNGLKPMEERFKGFELPYNADHYVFFTDNSHVFKKHVKSVGENAEIGDITTSRTIYTATGTIQEEYTLPVFITLPGNTETNK